ncbi:MAG: flagellar protein FlaG [Chloroflexi bacterium]|nr:flagellar protein FlaG [Chloroflexota bacterium]
MNEPTVTRTPGPEPGRAGRAGAVDRAASTRWLDGPAGMAEPPGHPVSSDRAAARATGGPYPPSYAHFAFNEKTQQVSIKIVDARTDEVIREIPPERVQRIAEELQVLARRGAGGAASGLGTGQTSRLAMPSDNLAGAIDRYV